MGRPTKRRTRPSARRPSSTSGARRLAWGLTAVLAVTAFAVGLRSAGRQPWRLFASGERKPAQVRSASRPAPSVATEAQPAGIRRRSRGNLPQPHDMAAPPPAPQTPAPAPLKTATPVAMHPPPTTVPATARAAVIIDDCGNNWKFVEGFVRAPAPVTLAILPHLPFSVYIAHEAHAAGQGIMLHFPLEPSGGQNPGPGTLKVAMTPEEMQETIRRNLAAVPDLQGVNNHEGSRASADPRAMSMLLEAVKQHGLFYIDSLTTPRSCASGIAEHLGLRFARRDIFLDNNDDVEAVKEQLRLLIREAAARGHAIGIGHARSATLTAFLEMLPAFEEAGVRLVLARDLAAVQPSASTRDGVLASKEAHP